MKKSNLTVAILAGGKSKRFRTEKAAALFKGKPLVRHMIRIAKRISPRVLVTLSNQSQLDDLRGILADVQIALDPDNSVPCALNGAVTAFEFAETEYTLLLPVDTPLANVELLTSLVKLCGGHGAVVPIWPSGNIEPLHAVYLTEHAYTVGLGLLEKEQRKMGSLVANLKNVLHISTKVLKMFDPNLNTFANANTEMDLRKLESHS